MHGADVRGTGSYRPRTVADIRDMFDQLLPVGVVRTRTAYPQPGRGKVLSLFPNGLVRRPNRTRQRGRIGIAFGRGLPRQARELTTSGDLHELPAGSEGSRPFFIENVECR